MTATRSRCAALARHLARAAAALALAGCALAGGAVAADAPPAAGAAAARCVEETGYMRRNHMDLLRHHRDRTVREGIRTTRHSLAGCVDCHADPQTRSVVGRNAAGRAGFCAGCHSYVAVQLDCFDCHATQPAAGVAAAGARR
ncbi:MAG: hypothetical protein IPG28_19700 [Betaproteobacteria bacterium]|nr:hypothetical protein [Betaproteobacteria bacterium]